jgi:hypothetical protein
MRPTAALIGGLRALRVTLSGDDKSISGDDQSMRRLRADDEDKRL